jgi:hypothetical protein
LAITYPATTYEQAIEMILFESNQLSKIVNGTSNEEITLNDESLIPSLRKMFLDNFHFKSPIDWQAGQTATIFNQLYRYNDSGNYLLYYAPFASSSNPITLGVTPSQDFVIFPREDLSLYAPLMSPTFTGVPTALTATNETNTTQLATTAFVQNVINSTFVGIPLPWPLSSVPSGWLRCNGQSFNTITYPLLAMAYPSGTLPDLRGEFIRGWDDSRGVDGVSGRSLLSWEPASLLCTAVGPDALHQIVIEGITPNSATVADFNSGVGTDFVSDSDYSSTLKGISAASSDLSYTGNSAGVPTSIEMNRPLNSNTGVLVGGMRPRNIAFNYIVRAA